MIAGRNQLPMRREEVEEGAISATSRKAVAERVDTVAALQPTQWNRSMQTGNMDTMRIIISKRDAINGRV